MAKLLCVLCYLALIYPSDEAEISGNQLKQPFDFTQGPCHLRAIKFDYKLWAINKKDSEK